MLYKLQYRILYNDPVKGQSLSSPWWDYDGAHRSLGDASARFSERNAWFEKHHPGRVEWQLIEAAPPALVGSI